MIRINLGKDGDGEPTQLTKLMKKFGGGVAAEKLGKLTNDVQLLVTLVIAAAVAFLPHMLFVQFRTFIMAEHKAALEKIDENVKSLDKEIEKLSAFKSELESYERQKKVVQDRLEAVRKLLLGRGKPVNVLDALAQSLPTRTWLTGIEFNMTQTPAQIRLTGQSYTNEDISDYIDKLTESIYFSDVRIEEVQTAKFENRIDVKTFHAVATPKGEFGPPKRSTASAGGSGAAPAVPPGAPPVNQAAPPPASPPAGGAK